MFKDFLTFVVLVIRWSLICSSHARHVSHRILVHVQDGIQIWLHVPCLTHAHFIIHILNTNIIIWTTYDTNTHASHGSETHHISSTPTLDFERIIGDVEFVLPWMAPNHVNDNCCMYILKLIQWKSQHCINLTINTVHLRW